ncbi:hypothetical protein BDV96DRAFT_594183 [Lophiotrema nucula]|uniref:Uncharacterized protein n=1 Tax=Lophiotrema nucula TaxID=690887 RepID=A0A6A5ZRH7_9PLEO|nr:hypothetical protein BDV96DRAFT_594183 [Lophiotrema nucula]
MVPRSPYPEDYSFQFPELDFGFPKVTIFVGRDGQVYADARAVEEVLPSLAHQVRFSGIVDGIWLFDELRLHLAPYNISPRQIQDGLLNLFRLLRSSNTTFEHLKLGLLCRLEHLLHVDINNSIYTRTNGLMRCRRRFLVLAGLADITTSTRLAKALACSFLAISEEVMGYERTMWLEEWNSAFEFLSSLLPPPLYEECVYILTHGLNYRRGRQSHRKRIMYAPRSRTVAPIQHRRQLLLPATAGQLMRSPSADYALAPTYGAANQELQLLAHNQQVMVQNQYAMQNQLGNIEAAVAGQYY